MKFGYFDDAKKEYVITSPRTPLPWINYLGSKDFFSLISNTCGGYSFYKDAKLLRLTRYRYNNVPFDSNGHYYYIKEGDTILITSPYGGPVEAKAVVSLIVPVGTIDAQYGWLDNQNTQKLMNRGNRDPLSGYPIYFENPVCIEKKA